MPVGSTTGSWAKGGGKRGEKLFRLGRGQGRPDAGKKALIVKKAGGPGSTGGASQMRGEDTTV